jgi:3-oxoacyl-[acyl-carrier protein] reductase
MNQTHRVALVTGGASGIGLATAERLAKDGFSVVIADRNEELARHETDALQASGLDVAFRVIDLTNEVATRALVQSLPPLAVLVNNAGIHDVRDFMEVTTDDFQRMFTVNVLTVATLTQEAVKRMEPDARIVNIASRACLGGKGYPHYVVSKAAVVGYTRACAMELAPRGILVNAIAPGLIDTPMMHALSPERRAEQIAAQPTGAAGHVNDIAHVVAFFASAQTRFITGQVLFVDGGKSLGGAAV